MVVEVRFHRATVSRRGLLDLAQGFRLAKATADMLSRPWQECGIGDLTCDPVPEGQMKVERNVNSIVPLGRDRIAKTSTGDESSACFRVVPPGLRRLLW